MAGGFSAVVRAHDRIPGCAEHEVQVGHPREGKVFRLARMSEALHEQRLPAGFIQAAVCAAYEACRIGIGVRARSKPGKSNTPRV
jgi:CO/xanthine dehydrogenase FAD-binding subunit